MKTRPTACDSARLERLLDADLTTAEQRAVESHLDDCAECRATLETLAAAPALWRETRQHLSSAVDVSGRRRPEETEGPLEVEFADSRSVLSGAAGELPTGAGPGELGGERAAAIEIVLRTLAPSDDPVMLGRIGPYEVQGVVGCGGMGVVLKCFDRALHRSVAVKVLAPHLATSGAARQRFAREAQAAAAVVHENVVAIHCVAESADLPYFVMPYLRTGSLQRRLDLHGPLSTKEILRIGLQVARGLEAAHRQGLVHRDIKPANVLVGDSVERVLITDFGLARAIDDASLTRTGVIAGTPLYMSPEQARGEGVDYRSDLFSLGSLLYAMATGRPPFRAETSLAVLRRICETEPRPIREINSEIPDWLARLVARLHQKDPARRFASAREVADVLERCLAHAQEPTRQPIPAELRSGWRALRERMGSGWQSWPRLDNFLPTGGARGERLEFWSAAICGLIVVGAVALWSGISVGTGADRSASNVKANAAVLEGSDAGGALTSAGTELGPERAAGSLLSDEDRWNDGVDVELRRVDRVLRTLGQEEEPRLERGRGTNP